MVLKSYEKKIKPWKIKKSKYLLKDQWIKVRADECITSDGIIISPYYVLEYPDWVHMVVIDNKNRILIVEQYRHGSSKVGFELPVGTLENSDRSPLKAAKRELLEETGYEGKFILAGKTSPNPANHSNYIYTYLVINPVKKRRPKQDKTEVLNYKFIKIDGLSNLIEKGKFRQALHISSFILGLNKLKSNGIRKI